MKTIIFEMADRQYIPVSLIALRSQSIKPNVGLACDCDGDCGQGDCDCSGDCDN